MCRKETNAGAWSGGVSPRSQAQFCFKAVAFVVFWKCLALVEQQEGHRKQHIKEDLAIPSKLILRAGNVIKGGVDV